MDYQKYNELLERYREADRVAFGEGETREGVIRRLIQISHEKKRIQTECNAIIRENIVKYEKEPALLDAEAQQRLKDFLNVLMQGGAHQDTPIVFRISKLLLRYYQEQGDVERTIAMLEYCSVFDIIIKEHLDDYAGSEYPLMAERYMADFDKFSDKAKSSLINSWLLSVINRRDMTFSLRKYKEIKKRIETIQWEAGKAFLAENYVRCRQNVLGFTLEACRRAAQAQKRGIAPDGAPLIDVEAALPYIEELSCALQEALDAENVRSVIADRVVARLYCVQAQYHLGRLSMEELLRQFEEISRPQEDYNAMEQCSALFTANAYCLDYLYKCSGYDDAYVLERSAEIVERVLSKAKDMEPYLGSYQTNYCVLMLVNSASGIMDFDSFMNTMLSATIYANKALYVHTMMVKEICDIILRYILAQDPQYLDGLAGHGWEDCRDHPEEVLGLMEKCTLFHDIGKYFCLDYVSNSSRNLTDDEFEVIKAHPTNFSKIYQGKMSREVECVHDCALLHHLWYNEQGGYPKAKHTANKPFVNILSIADSIDAATDDIGRPYGQGKTLAQLMEEFDGMRDSRYSGYVCDLFHVDEVREQIQRALDERRKEIYCDIYLPAGSGRD
ncbi:MAG: hypothetical protein NC337_00815 [Roseburia sp.]|nr:hypothetical protein [Roseburia sp.]